MDARLKITVDKIISEDKLAKIKTPAIIFDLKILKENYRLIKDSIADGNCSIKYAVKANNEEKVIKTLNSLGSGFEIASIGELNLLKNQGVSPDKIFYSSPVKLTDHIKAAYSFGIRYFAFDSSQELVKIAENAPGSNVYLRIDVSNRGSVWKLDSKFGARSEDWIDLLLKAKKLNLKVKGITFLVGWNNTNLNTWRRAVIRSSKLIKAAVLKDFKIEFLNIGGGFPAHLVNQADYLKLICREINPILNKLIKDYSIKIYAEPGTFMVDNCGALLTRIYAKLKRKKGHWLFIDASIMGGFYEIFAGTKFEIEPSSIYRNSPYNTDYTVTGPTCDSYDIFFKNAKLPKQISEGDFLIISPAGAYITSRKEYNGFSYPENKFID